MKRDDQASCYATFTRGSILGEAAALLVCRHSRTARALTAVRALTLTSEAFAAIGMRFPDVKERAAAAFKQTLAMVNASNAADLIGKSRARGMLRITSGDAIRRGSSFRAASPSSDQPNIETEADAGLLAREDSTDIIGNDVAVQASDETIGPFMAAPKDAWLRWWAFLKFVAAAYASLSVSGRIAFQGGAPSAALSSSVGNPSIPYLVLDCIVDVFFWADIAVSLRSAVIHRGRLISTPVSVALHYWHSGQAALDVAASLPLEWCFYSLCPPSVGAIDSVSGIGTGVSTWLLLRLNRVLRLVDMRTYVDDVGRSATANIAALRFARVFMYALTLLHVVACGWYDLGRALGFGSDPWLPFAAPVSESSVASAYVNALFLSLNLVGGIGDCGIPRTLSGLAFANACALVGVFAFAYVVGSFDSLAELTGGQRRAHASRVDVTARLLDRYEVTALTRREIFSHLAHVWTELATGKSLVAASARDEFDGNAESRGDGAGRDHENADAGIAMALEAMPDVLRLDVSVDLARTAVERAPLFVAATTSSALMKYDDDDEGADGEEEDAESSSNGDSSSFVTSCVALCEWPIRCAVPGEWLVREGDRNDPRMFFLLSGKADILRRTRQRRSQPNDAGANDEIEADGDDDVDEIHQDMEADSLASAFHFVGALTEGSSFGELAVFFNVPRRASIRATSHCEVLALHRDSVELLMRLYPRQARRMRRWAAWKQNQAAANAKIERQRSQVAKSDAEDDDENAPTSVPANTFEVMDGYAAESESDCLPHCCTRARFAADSSGSKCVLVFFLWHFHDQQI